MYDQLREYIESLFKDAPDTVKTVELKEEMLQNLYEKYNDLLAEGRSEQAAFNIAVAGVGDVGDLIETLRSDGPAGSPVQTESARRRSAALVSAAVMLYILSVVPCILLPDLWGPVLLFVFCAAATGLLIYNGMTRTCYRKADDTMVEQFREWKDRNDSRTQICRAIAGAVWALAVVAYFLISFFTQAWHITWLLFPIAGAATAVVKAAFDLTR